MPSVNHVLEVYQDLASWYEQRGQAQLRDRFLVLAADAALSSGRVEEAERLRSRLLQQNPHHLLKPYTSLAEAIKVPAVLDYVADLRRSYPAEVAEQQLGTLRASTEVAPPRSASAAPRPPAEKPPAHEPPPKEPARDSPDVQLFYPVKDDAIPHTMSIPRKKIGEHLLRPVGPPPSSPARAPAEEPQATPRPQVKKPVRPSAVAPFLTEPLLPPPSRSASAEKDQEDLATGFWVATTLYAILLLAGIGLAGYTLIRPFLPIEWFQ
jgi:hypothetical protein